MDNLLEILVPLIFAAIYFFGNMLSGKSDDEAAPSRPPTDEEADVIERQRRIQAEIRRKIMERRREESGAPSPEPQQPMRRQSESFERTRRRTEPSESVRESRSPQPASQQPNQYQTEMEARLQKIEATKRKAEQLKKQVAATSRRREPVDSSTRQSQPRTGRFAGSVRASLRDPAAARAAFIYGEVLGPPISQRKTQTVPGLS